jgi:ATP-dependent Clp protease ATP-binding subunit ClpA
LTLLLASRQRHYLTELFVLLLLADESTGLKAMLTRLGVAHSGLVKGIEFLLVGLLRHEQGSQGPSISELFQLAGEEAQSLGSPAVEPAHLFLALVADGRSPIINCLPESLTADALRNLLRSGGGGE